MTYVAIALAAALVIVTVAYASRLKAFRAADQRVRDAERRAAEIQAELEDDLRHERAERQEDTGRLVARIRRLEGEASEWL